MKNIAFALFGLLILVSCNKEDLPKDTPKCISDKIEDIADGDPWNPAAKIYSYQYNGETVYYFPAHCCDFPSKVYDSNCKRILHLHFLQNPCKKSNIFVDYQPHNS